MFLHCCKCFCFVCRYMICARQVTVRAFPEFYAQDIAVAPTGGVVRVFEQKEVQCSYGRGLDLAR